MPILVLSAVGDEAEKIRALDAGADDYVTKPFAPGELVARLNAALRRAGKRPAEEAGLSVDGLEVDLAARVVRRDGEPVHLTPTEFELLRMLVRERGRLLTHRMLLSEVWGPSYEEDAQVLRVHIANLRRKIEPDTARPALHHHRSGRGLPLLGLAAFTRSVYAGRRPSRGLDGAGSRLDAWT